MNSSTSDAPEFSITRVFPARRELVWQAWTDETELAQWLHPFGVSADSVSFDVRVGGRYRYTMTNDTTGERFPTGGEYIEVEPFDRLVFTWGNPMRLSMWRRSSRSLSRSRARARNSFSTYEVLRASLATVSSTTAGTRLLPTSVGTLLARSWADT